MLLVLGDSGSGKTHLLRAFRRHVHDNRLGYTVYAQLQSRANDYGRYLLHNVVSSLEKPYKSSVPERTGLHELATGLQHFAGEQLRTRMAQLASAEWPEGASVAEHVNDLVDDLLRRKELCHFDPDFLRVLLYAMREEPAVTARAAKYLRCEEMTTPDRRWIGEVAARTGPDDPLHRIRNIARLVHVTQGRSLVLMVDQAELAGFSDERKVSFRRAADALYQVVSDVPSAVHPRPPHRPEGGPGRLCEARLVRGAAAQVDSTRTRALASSDLSAVAPARHTCGRFRDRYGLGGASAIRVLGVVAGYGARGARTGQLHAGVQAYRGSRTWSVPIRPATSSSAPAGEPPRRLPVPGRRRR